MATPDTDKLVEQTTALISLGRPVAEIETLIRVLLEFHQRADEIAAANHRRELEIRQKTEDEKVAQHQRATELNALRRQRFGQLTAAIVQVIVVIALAVFACMVIQRFKTAGSADQILPTPRVSADHGVGAFERISDSRTRRLL